MRRTHVEETARATRRSARQGAAIAPPRFGTRRNGGPLPCFDRIQRAFGAHDLRSVVAHVRPQATAGARVTSPVYGAQNTAKSTATKLKHNAPESSGNHRGIRNRIFANTCATLWDKPSSRIDHRGANSKTFETSAVVLTRKHKGRYLGLVRWGHQRAARGKGAPDLAPSAKVSHGDPSAQVQQAAADWNAVSTALKPLVAVPTPHGGGCCAPWPRPWHKEDVRRAPP